MTRLIDRLISRQGYWEGMASGAAVFTTSYGSPDREAILPQFAAWAQRAGSGNSVVFAAMLLRLMVFSEASFTWQALDDKHLFGKESLGILEHPWPGGTGGELLARMEQDVTLAGNAYIWHTGERLVRLRPDWVTIVSQWVTSDDGRRYREPVGYWWEPPKGLQEKQGEGQMFTAEEVAHWHPVPDSAADFRGQSWLTPAVREIQGDDGLTGYKIKYLENSASPNLLIKYASKLQPATLDNLRERITARYGGVGNAFKTLILDQGADVTIIGNSLAQMDFSNVSQAGTDRILADSMVPGVLIGLEPLRGAGRGYQESMRKFSDMFLRPQWRSACGALERIVPPPTPGTRLWYDASDVAALQDGEMEKGQTALVRMQAVLTGRQAGFTRESVVIAVASGDLTKLQPDPAIPVPGAGSQHLLPQAQPGATADPLPAGTQARLPLGSISPGDGGNQTRPAPQLAAGRRALTGANGRGDL